MNGVGEGEGANPTRQALWSPFHLPGGAPGDGTAQQSHRGMRNPTESFSPLMPTFMLDGTGKNEDENLNLASERVGVPGWLCGARGCWVGITAPRVPPVVAGLQPGHSLDIP